MPTLSEEIVEEVRNRSASLNRLPGIRMAAMGLGYAFVELDNDTMGVCFTPRWESDSCTHYAKAGTLAQKSTLELTELMLSSHPLEKSIGIAAVNALSQVIMAQTPDHYCYVNMDFLELVPFTDMPVKVGMVGSIGPFISYFLKKAASLIVVDDNPALHAGIQADGYSISRDVKDLADVGVLIITGSSAAVADFDQVLETVKAACFVGVVGPSAGWLPGPAFRRGVQAVAATKILNVAAARRAILEGGGAPHLMACGRKYTILNAPRI